MGTRLIEEVEAEMDKVQLNPQPLTSEAFKKFGDVISANDVYAAININYGNTQKFANLAAIDVEQHNGRAALHIYKAQPLTMPMSVNVMENHPLGSQLFFPLNGQRYLIVVAPAGEFDADKLKAFQVRGDQGVNYHAGTWHHFCFSLDQESDFLVVDRMGEGNNCEEVFLPKDKHIIDLTETKN